MRTLADLRFRHADTFGLTSGTWKHFQVALTPVLGMTVVGNRVRVDANPGFLTSPPAAPEDCGLLMLAAMLRGDRSTIAERVLLRWHSRITDAPDGECPVTKARFFHEAMVAVLRLPELAQRIDHIELTREFAASLIAWTDTPQSRFETLDPHDRVRRETIMSKGRLLTVAMLGGSVFHDIATWIAEDPETARPRPVELIEHE